MSELTNKEILQRAIEKAEENGWKKPAIIMHEDTIDLWNPVDLEDDQVYVYGIIFSHEFAKAFWGEGDKSFGRRMLRIGDAYYPFYKNGWRLHLQQMVLEEEPLKYLAMFL